MKNAIRVLGITALVAVIGLLAGCALEVKMVKETPMEERASLYLRGDDVRIVKLDGKNVGMSGMKRQGQKYSRMFWGTYILGTNTDRTNNVINRSMYLTPGEHTVTISRAAMIGRRNVDLTFDFETGKKYIVMLDVPSNLEVLNAESFEETASNIVSGFGTGLKETFTGDYIAVIAETTADPPKYPNAPRGSIGKWQVSKGQQGEAE